MQLNRIDCSKQHRRTMNTNTMCMFMWLTVASTIFCATTSAVTIDKAAYKDIVIEIKDYVPVEKCADVLLDIEVCEKIYIIYM